MTAEDIKIADIKGQMQTLDAVLRGLDGKEDPMAEIMRSNAQDQLKSLRHQLTSLRPLPAQISTMEEYAARKSAALQDARDALQQAQLDVMIAEQEHMEAMHS